MTLLRTIAEKERHFVFLDAPNVQMCAAEASYGFIECRDENTPAAAL